MALFERASEVIPGGIYGHLTPALLVPGASPYYAASASGCRYTDVDGNEYLDLMCCYGPIVLGYNHPEVEQAAARQRELGDCFNHPAPVMVELAERLVSLIDFAGWCVFGKNGSDMTTWAVQVAREQTGRRKVLIAEGAYHGMDPWCTPGHGGLIEEDLAHVHRFRYNDVDSLDAELALHGDDIAAIVLTPFHHPLYRNSELPDPDFAAHVNTCCSDRGIVFVLDDVRAGFRLSIGGSHALFGFEPDLACYSKAIANGYALSAAVGTPQLRAAASRVFLTGSFWNAGVAMAAALATIEIMQRDRSLEHARTMGERLCRGLEDSARANGLQVRLSGPPAMPFMTFANESNLYRSQHFTRECLARGMFVHPYHNWFVSAAMTPSDIDQAIAIAGEAFASVRERFAS
ncbi:MAG: aminotransferase class III-fold pyridoxal phosphate-dependent enzyme [Gammaproteobacteria bacterium]